MLCPTSKKGSIESDARSERGTSTNSAPVAQWIEHLTSDCPDLCPIRHEGNGHAKQAGSDALCERGLACCSAVAKSYVEWNPHCTSGYQLPEGEATPRRPCPIFAGTGPGAGTGVCATGPFRPDFRAVIETDDDATISFEWHGYGRAYPPGRRQIVGSIFH